MDVQDFDEIDIQKVAALHCEGMNRQEIAEILFVPENDVDRMIEAASQMGYFYYQPRLASQVLSPEVHERFTAPEIGMYPHTHHDYAIARVDVHQVCRRYR